MRSFRSLFLSLKASHIINRHTDNAKLFRKDAQIAFSVSGEGKRIEARIHRVELVGIQRRCRWRIVEPRFDRASKSGLYNRRDSFIIKFQVVNMNLIQLVVGRVKSVATDQNAIASREAFFDGSDRNGVPGIQIVIE